MDSKQQQPIISEESEPDDQQQSPVQYFYRPPGSALSGFSGTTSMPRGIGLGYSKQIQFADDVIGQQQNVRIRRAPSKNDLKNRLYDKGLSMQTMPSVKRPANFEATQPVQVAMSKPMHDLKKERMDLQKTHKIPKLLPPSSNSKLLQQVPPTHTSGGVATTQTMLRRNHAQSMTRLQQPATSSTDHHHKHQQQQQQLPLFAQTMLMSKLAVNQVDVGGGSRMQTASLMMSSSSESNSRNQPPHLSSNLLSSMQQHQHLRTVTSPPTSDAPIGVSGRFRQNHHQVLKSFQETDLQNLVASGNSPPQPLHTQMKSTTQLINIPSMQTLDAHPSQILQTYQDRPQTTHSNLQILAQNTGGLLSGAGTSRMVSNPQFTTLNMAPYHRPQSQAFGFRHPSLTRDPSKKTLRPSEEISSITGIKTMTALGPSLQNNNFKHRRTSCAHAEELLKQRAKQTKQLKRLIINAANTNNNAAVVNTEEVDDQQVLNSVRQQAQVEQQQKLSSAALINSPMRKDMDGKITFIGRQEHEDEVLRSHYLLMMKRSKEGNMPPIQRGQQAKAQEVKSPVMKSASLTDIHQYKQLLDTLHQPHLAKHLSTYGNRNHLELQSLAVKYTQETQERIEEVDSTQQAVHDNNAGTNQSEHQESQFVGDEDLLETKRSIISGGTSQPFDPNHPSGATQNHHHGHHHHSSGGNTKWKDLDKLITILQTQTEDDGYFIYLKPGDLGDPYDLQPLVDSVKTGINSVSKSKAGSVISKKGIHQQQVQKIDRFFTLSRKGITTYVNDEPVDYISLTDWLIERNYYLEIRSKPFFHEFRRWKVLRMWRRNILHKKREEVRSNLAEKLFIVDGVFGPILQHHRNMCKDLEQYRLVNLAIGAGKSGDEAVTLAEFAAMQTRQREYLGSKIEEASASSRHRFRQGINAVLDDLRNRINEYNNQEEAAAGMQDEGNNPGQFGKLDGAIKERRTTGSSQNPVFEQLGFKHNLKYGPRSKLRKACTRFLRFSYILDFIALETLSNIFVDSVKDTIVRLRDLSNVKPDFDLKPVVKNVLGEIVTATTTNTAQMQQQPCGGQRKAAVDYLSPPVPPPLFKVFGNILSIATKPHVHQGSEGIPLKAYKQLKLNPFDCTQTSNKDFDPLVHIEIEEHPQEDQDEREDNNGDDSEEKIVERVKVENLHEYWLLVEPSQADFASLLREALQDEGLDCLRRFERYSRHEELLPYVRVLESWDDRVCEGEWELPDDFHLRCDEWLQDNYWFVNLDFILDRYLTAAYENVNTFFGKMEPFLQAYWENKRLLLDFDKGLQSTVAHDDLKNPLDVIPLLLQRFNDQKTDSENMIPPNKDLGLLRINLASLKQVLTPQAKSCFNKLRHIFPQVVRIRMDQHKRWLQSQITAINKPPSNVLSYVKQIQALEYLERNYQGVKDKIELSVQLFSICVHFEIESKEDKNRKFIDDIYAIMATLNQTIVRAHEMADKRKDQMKHKIMDKIPKLKEGVMLFQEVVNQDRFLDINSPFEQTLNEVMRMEEECSKLVEKSKDIVEFQKTLDMDVSPFDYVEDARVAMMYRAKLWRSLHEWGGVLVEKWKTAPFEQVEIAEITAKSEHYTKIALQCERNLPPHSTAVQRLKQLVFDFRESMPIVEALGNDKLTSEHWQEIKTATNIPADFPLEDRSFNLGQLIAFNVAQYQDQIVNISVTATQEYNLRQQLEEIKTVWASKDFKLAKHKDRSDAFKLTDLDDVQTALDESLTNVSNILGSRYVKRLQHEAEVWQQKLNVIADTLEAWKEFQRAWLYLDNIFTSPDLRKNCPRDSQDFEIISRQWIKLMKTVQFKANVQANCQNGQKLQDFSRYNLMLDRIQKNLDAYLEQKRQQFPRFYFLSNDELLQILANAHDIKAVEKHINKCFDNICGLLLQESGGNVPDITGMISSEREEVEFHGRVKLARGGAGQGVEVWMKMIEGAMQNIVQRKVKEAHAHYYQEKVQRKDWVLSHIGQAVAAVAQVTWTEACEMAINDMETQPFALQDYLAGLKQQLSQLTTHIQSTSLDTIKRKILVALITTDVHARDIVETLANEQVETLGDFNWQQQLRYYIEDDFVVVRQVNATIEYGYEYMGATSRLVITPLTDRCWITITGAMHIKLGAAPAGPAGTGKTESTKDLAKALGIYCVVFNCSEQIEYKMMARLFSGLAQSGAWSCLDEFNRIDVEVLSVIAQQLLDIREAKLQNKLKFTFNCQEMDLKPTCGVFVTMNPGYAGRTELPDNLKVLFRPVSMMIPNYGLIAEIMLFAEGFENAKTLSTKMVQLYKLASEQLSQQDHYDFGMRAVKSVLVMAGTLKRANPELSEDVVLIRAMRDSNIPKFLAQDLPLFSALIQDLFPGIKIPEANYGELAEQVEKSLQEMNLQNVQAFATKVIQLFDTFNVRFGVMIVGPTGAGKSTCYKVLGHAMTQLRTGRESKDSRFQEVRYKVLNPKSITMGELYGEENNDTKEWTDGLASKIIRKFAKEDDTIPNPRLNWCVFDGPVDALWIENMNTVLDDNMTLCLANGERIKLKWSMRMLFEVQDLAVASPATVSRCGMVYMTPSELGWHPYLKSWLTSFCQSLLHEEACHYLEDLFTMYFDDAWNKTRHIPSSQSGSESSSIGQQQQSAETMPTVQVQVVRCICNFLEHLFTSQNHAVTIEEKKEVWSRKLNFYFGFAFIWGFGASYKTSALRYLDNMMRDFFGGKLHIPLAETVFEYYFNEKEQKFVHWSRIVSPFVYDPKTPFFQLMVPTIDTLRYTTLLDMLLVGSPTAKPVFFTGSTGVGKSVILQSYLQQQQQQSSSTGGGNLSPIYLTFSAQTDSNATQQTIEAKLEKKRGKKVIGAKQTSTCVIFVDDVNMPTVERYGAQPPIELLRQLLDQGGFYDRPQFFFKQIEKFIILCAAAPPGGGRSALTPRFMRHFHIFNLPDPSEESMRSIFEAILREFLSHNHFPESVRKLAGLAVAATVDMYTQITNNLLPIPAKFHYTFNLRDVAKVFQGMLMTKPQSVTSGDVFAKLWLHECCRVFNDRLINEHDRGFFKQTANDLLKSKLKVNWNLKEIDLYNGRSQVLFSVLLRVDQEELLYEEITPDSKPKLFKQLEDKLTDYNISCSSSKMDLVFFDDAISHVCRISRILRQPRGNAMLIGVSGCGKQSLTRLSSYMLECKCFQIKLSKNYKPVNFRDDLKLKMLDAGCDALHSAFLMTDTQIMYESFLEDINNILNTGEITNLYQKEDFDRMFASLSKVNQQMKRPETKDCIYQTFIERVRDYFHVILCMSPVGDSLRIRCRKFPSLVNCCTLDWFDNWPEEALLNVSQRFLSQVPDLAPSKEDAEVIRGKLSKMFTEVHKSVEDASLSYFEELRRKVYVTPKSYLDGINMYLLQLAEKKREAKENVQRLGNGCKKLKDTNEQIADLQVNLSVLIPKLEEENRKSNLKAVEIQENKKIASQKEAIVEQESAYVQNEANKVEALKRENDVELAKCKPELEEAERAVSELNKDNITELKTFKQPPKVVEMVIACVFIYLGYPPLQDWKQALTVISDIKFLDRIKGYDNKNIPQKTLYSVGKMISEPSFNPNEMASKSKVAGGLAKWCKATYRYAEAWKIVKPKEQRQRELTEKLQIAEQEVAVKKQELGVVQAEIAKMEAEYQELQGYIDKLTADKEKSERRLMNAGKLIELLGDEGERWLKTVDLLSKEVEKLVGNVFIAAASISYLGPFTGGYRDRLVQEWIKLCKAEQIPITDKYSLVNTLGDPVEIRTWNICGLPSDSVSIDNGILATKTSRWPLMIDPQNQANQWIKRMCKNTDTQLKVIKLSDGASYQKSMESAIISGATVLIEDVSQELDPGLDVILTKAIYKDEGLEKINFGDRPIIYDRNFKLYITTKLANPHFLPETCIKLTIINFTVTFDGLEEQMLVDVVVNEAPEVEKKRDGLVMSIAGYKNEMKKLENKILKDLAESNSDTILDNQDLIETLESAKTKSKLIAECLVEAEDVEKTINETRNAYREVSVRGSILYFVISDLAQVDPMYQNSLAYVKKLFNDAIALTPQSDTLPQRIQLLLSSITETLYVNICRGLFEQHKLLYSFLICTSIQRQSGRINEQAWNYLLRGAGVIKNRDQQESRPQWMSEGQWDLVECLDEEGLIGGLAEKVRENSGQWERYSMRENIDYFEDMPCGYGESLGMFDKLLILKVFKPEKLMFAFQRYVLQELGQVYSESPVASMDALFSSSDQKTPIIFVLSQGADPTQQVIQFAHKMKFYDRLYYKSLGQGQERVATQMIEKGRKEGHWVLLQNCHLFKSWMPSLEVICDKFRDDDTGTTHEDFRLIMTSMPADYFPAAILQNGLKMTTEPPRGIKANLKRSYTNLITEETYQSCGRSTMKSDVNNQQAFNKLLFGLCFFHAVVQERRKFGPLGWNIRYEFNDSDLDTSVKMLRNFLLDSEIIPWDAMRYMTGQINYGGRVTDDWDRILLLNILRRFYNEALVPDTYDPDDSQYSYEQANVNYALSESGIYRIFSHSSIEEIRTYIDSLPPSEEPEVFGLHPNANISFQKQESEKIIFTVLNVQPRVTTVSKSAEARSPEDAIFYLAQELLTSIPPMIDREEHAKDIFKPNNKGLLPCLSTVLIQEIERYNRLLLKITSSLSMLSKAVKGLVIMSPELDEMCTALTKNLVPPNWSAVAYPSLKSLASWIKDLCARVEFMREWLKHGNPHAFWLSGFFFPHGFMTGTLQTYARKHLKPIDQLTFKFKILSRYDPASITRAPKDGIYIYGLYLEGAKWSINKQHLDEQLPGEMTSSMPVIHFLPHVLPDQSLLSPTKALKQNKKRQNQLDGENNISDSDEDEDLKFKCPVYKTSVRAGTLSTTGQSTNYIIAIDLPMAEVGLQEHWSLRGTALITMLND